MAKPKGLLLVITLAVLLRQALPADGQSASQPTVTFSFCYISGNTDPPSLVYGAYASYISGLFNTSAAAYKATGSYTLTGSVNGLFHAAGSTATLKATLVPSGDGVYVDNDNVITIKAGSNVAAVDGEGLAFRTSEGQISDYDNQAFDASYCGGNDICGAYSALHVQLYNSSAPAMIACSPLSNATVQLSFCLITGNADPPALTVGGYLSYTSGVFNTSSTVYSETGSYALTGILNGQFRNASSSLALPATLLAPRDFDNDNVITLKAGTLQAETDDYGLGIGTPLTKLEAYSDNGDGYGEVSCSDPSTCGEYSVLYVQQYNSSGAVLPCAPQTPVVFSFCLVTGNANPPSLLYGAYSTYTSGLIYTTSTQYNASATYTAGSISGGQFRTSGSSKAQTVTLAAEDEYGRYGGNDNSFTVRPGTSVATLGREGLAIVVGKADIDAYDNLGYQADLALCSNQTLCGAYSLLYVQLYNSSAPAMIACSPLSNATVQLSFCLITGNADPPALTVGGYLSYTSGVFNTSSTVYSETGSYALTGILNGQFRNASSSLALPATLLAPRDFDNDNVITLKAGTLQAETDDYGLGIGTPLTKLEAYSDNGDGYGEVSCSDPSTCGEYSVLYVQQYNSSGAVLPCAPQTPVVFSFCLVTGNANPPSLLYGAYSTYTSGLIYTTSTQYNASATYTAGSISGGQFRTSGSSKAQTVTLAAEDEYGRYGGNDNSFTVRPGTSVATLGREGLAIVVGKADIDAYDNLGYQADLALCSNQTLCGAYSLLYVQLYNSSAPAMIACSPLSNATVQLSFCLITGNADPPALTVGGYLSYTSGVFNTSSTVYSETGSYALTGILNGQFRNASSSLALPATLLAPRDFDNDNVITLKAGTLQAETDDYGLGIGTPLTKLEAYSDNGDGYGEVSCSDPSTCGEYSVLYVQQYNSSGAVLPCAPQTPVVFSFCLVTGNANPPSLLYGAYSTYTSGLIYTTSTQYNASATYTAGSISGGQFRTSGSSKAQTVTLAAEDEYGRYGGNDNSFTVRPGTSVATLGREGLAIVVGKADIDAYDNLGYQADLALCSNQTLCGAYSLLYVQLYNSSAPAMIACSPLSNATVQLSFCLITGNADPPALTVGGYLSYTSGVFNTSSTVYSETGSYALTGILNGQFRNASSSLALPATLLAPRDFDNDNVITLKAGTLQAVTDGEGLGIGTPLTQLEAYNDNGDGYGEVYCSDPGTCGEYSVLYVQQYNSSGAVLPCAPQTPVVFSFCLVTGNANPPSLLYGAYNTYTSGLIYTTSTQYNASATYTAGSIIDGQLRNSSSSVVQAASLLPSGTFEFNDNLFTLQSGSESAALDEQGLAIATQLFSLLAYDDGVLCSDGGACGSYSALFVQLYNASAPANISCSPTAAAGSSSTGSSGPFTSSSSSAAKSKAGKRSSSTQSAFSSSSSSPSPVYSAVAFSFCLVTGPSPTPSLAAPGQYLTYISGVMDTSAAQYSGSGLYTVTGIGNGVFHNSSSAQPQPAVLLKPGAEGGNDNVLTLQSGSSQAALDSGGLAISTPVVSMNVHSGGVDCNDDYDCGAYFTLSVQLFNASTGSTIPCEPPQTSSSSSSGSLSVSAQLSSSSPPAVHHSSSSPTSSPHHSSSSSRKYVTSSSREHVTSSSRRYVTSSSRRYVTSSSKKFLTSSSSRQPASSSPSSSSNPRLSSSSSSSSSSSLSGSVGPTPLLLNGGFENGGFLPGWNESGSGLSVACAPVAGYSARSGSCFALLGAAGNNSLLQQSVQLSRGQRYNLSLFLAADGGTPSDFEAVYQFTGQAPVTAFSAQDPPASGYSLYSALIPALRGSGAINLTLSLLSRDDPGYLALDDVSIVPLS